MASEWLIIESHFSIAYHDLLFCLGSIWSIAGHPRINLDPPRGVAKGELRKTRPASCHPSRERGRLKSPRLASARARVRAREESRRNRSGVFSREFGRRVLPLFTHKCFEVASLADMYRSLSSFFLPLSSYLGGLTRSEIYIQRISKHEMRDAPNVASLRESSGT